VLGLLLGGVLALLLGRFDRRVRNAGELGEAFGLPVLGNVPESRALAAFVGDKGNNSPPEPLPFVETELFRMLGTRLRYFNSGSAFRSVVVTSALPREGKTTVAANLAMTEAGAGSSVLLVEADLRKPVLAVAEDLHRVPGLAEVLTGQSALARSLQRVAGHSHGQDPTRHLDVIVAGATPSNPVELIQSQDMATLLEEVSAAYDLVVVDAPPPTVLADAIPLIKLADGVLVVAQLREITRDDVARLREQLGSLDAHVLGVVANRTPKDREHGYGDYYRSDRPRRRLWSGPIASPRSPGSFRSQEPLQRAQRRETPEIE
jgi:capsular exopolysaccharide synthesis family protein